MSLRSLGQTLIARSGFGKTLERAFVDKTYYRTTYTDVALAGVDPFNHYVSYGWREGRNPSAYFNTMYYRDAYLGGVAINPLEHFLVSGRARDCGPVPPSIEAFVKVQRNLTTEFFDGDFYRLQIGNVEIEDLLTHYLTIGWKNEKSPSPTFDAQNYVVEFPYVKTLGVSPLYHFASQQRLVASKSQLAVLPVKRRPAMSRQDRRDIQAAIESEFDIAYYNLHQPDVARAGMEPLAHFIDHGWREGRNPSALFNCRYYLETNKDVAEADINPFYHFVTIGRSVGRRGSPIGDRLYPSLIAPLESAWDRLTPAAGVSEAEFIVIIPVYKGYDETLAAIHSVLVAKQTTPFALHVINDVSPDPKLTEALEALAARGLFSYTRNAVNVGFVKSVNAGLRRFSEKEVILLNSDAKVAGNWLDRMAAHAKRDRRIATITPLSNNATICSYPVVNENNVVETECSAEILDALAAECNKGRVTNIPTGVGFCFYMSRASRTSVGIFDEEAFGRGYGEENDFCLRVAKAGFRNVLAEDIFVFHAGEISFSEFVKEEYGPGQTALLSKHPDYPARVDQHLKSDASAIGRMRLDLFRLARHFRSNAIVFIYHALAGGIVTHIEHLEQRLLEAGVSVIHVRVGVGGRWNVDIKCDFGNAPYCPNLLPFAFHMVKPHLTAFLQWLSPKAIHVHSLVGFDWVATLGLIDIIRHSKMPYYFTLHDYSIVCHRNDLVQVDETYCGLPEVTVCRSCVAADYSYPEGVDPLARRQTYGSFLADAAGVFSPSEDIKKRLIAAGATYAIKVRPHEEVLKQTPIIRAPRDGTVIDVVTIGAIGPHKGSRVLLSLARDAKRRSLPIRYTIIGHSDVSDELAAVGVMETGPYKSEAELFGHLRRCRPSCILLPSIWPETFCYALSAAFKAKIPPLVFDIGAQADRVRAAGFGFVLPYALIDEVGSLNDRICALPYEYTIWASEEDNPVVYASILKDYYGL